MSGEHSLVHPWSRFSEQVRCRRRWCVRWEEVGVESLEVWLPRVLEECAFTMEADSRLFRARLGPHTGTEYEIEDVGAPPPDKATSGRANPVGIPYFYAASAPRTAVAEVRPWKGATVTVAEAFLQKPLRIVDLKSRDVRRMREHDSLSGLQEQFLKGFRAALTSPVNQETTAVDYLPTQFVCEVLHCLGADGVAYPSALGPDYNVVVFTKESVKIRERPVQYEVRGVIVSSRTRTGVSEHHAEGPRPPGAPLGD